MPTLDYETPAKHHHRHDAGVGLAYGLAAYTWWGLVPAYFKLIAALPPLMILSHRIFWSVLFLLPLIAWRGLWPEVRQAFVDRKTLLTLLASTLFIAVNWFVFIYAISINQIVQTSLGYYMNPLVVVLLGVIFLRERLRIMQIVCIAIAAAAVAILTITQRQFPVIAITLAISFAMYGFVRKTTPAGPMVGLFVETLLLLPAAMFLIARFMTTPDAPRFSPGFYGLVALAGVITALPLLWFANSARRMRMVTMGLLQYIAPTVSFLLAVLFYNESFSGPRLIAFPMIWLALLLFSIDSLVAYNASRRTQTRSPAEEPVRTFPTHSSAEAVSPSRQNLSSHPTCDPPF
jgi:chloramphenicol-sensitive protein RarD